MNTRRRGRSLVALVSAGLVALAIAPATFGAAPPRAAALIGALLPPIAVNDTMTTIHDRTKTVPAPGVLANDIQLGSGYTAELVSGATHGSVSLLASGAYTYTPDSGYVGSDSFRYRVNGGLLNLSLPATVSITVTNVAPVAANDSYAATIGVELVVAAPGVLANDSDADGDSITAVLVDGSGNGSLSLSSNGSFRFTSGGSFTGSRTFTYRASDGIASSATRTVTITVTAPAPTATPTPPPTPTPTPTPSPTPTPAPTPTPTPTPTPAPGSTPTPSPAPTATPRPTPTPTPTLIPSLPVPSLPVPSLPIPSLPLPTLVPTPTPLVSLPPIPGATGTPGPSASARSGATATPAAASPSPDASSSAVPGSAAPVGAGGTGGGGGSSGSPTQIDRFVLPPIELTGLDTIIDASFNGFGAIEWAVPAFALVVPGLLLILAIGAQATISIAWLPMVRRWLGGFGVRRRRRTA